MKKTCKKTQSQIEITASNLSVPIFASLLKKLEDLKELAKKTPNAKYKAEKFHFWRSETATEKLRLKYINDFS